MILCIVILTKITIQMTEFCIRDIYNMNQVDCEFEDFPDDDAYDDACNDVCNDVYDDCDDIEDYDEDCDDFMEIIVEYCGVCDREYDRCICRQIYKIPKPINLSSLQCDCYRCVWRGEDKQCSQLYSTFNEMKIFLTNETEKKIKQTLDNIDKNLEVKSVQKREQEELRKKFLASLPKESRATIRKREEKKKQDEERNEKLRRIKYLLRKRNAAKSGKCSKGSIRFRKTTSEDTIKNRRAFNRTQRKLRNKQEEKERKEYFANMTIPKVNRIIENLTVEVSEESDIDTGNEIERFDIKTYISDESEKTNSTDSTDSTDSTETVNSIKKWKNTPQNTPQNTPKNDNDWTVVKKNTQLCISVKHNIPCKYKNNCKYSHDVNLLKDNKPEEHKKTLMCNSIMCGKVCKYGNRCNFAHDINELNVTPCFYGHNCHNIYTEISYSNEKKYKNRNNKTCYHIHPNEDIFAYYDRCKIPYNKNTSTLNNTTCKKKCCVFSKCDYNVLNDWIETKRNRKKAGVFVCDPVNMRILIVQSRNNLWGSPKGTIENGETPIECAIRELKEETSISVSELDLKFPKKIRNKSVYYYMEMNYKKTKINLNDIEDDISGISWVHIDCLKNMIDDKTILVTQHFKILVKKFTGINL